MTFPTLYNVMRSLLTDPKKIFLLDGIGAFVTSFLLLVVIRHKTELFGVLPSVCVKLSVIAFVYCVYSLACHFLAREKWRGLLKIIAAANILYCITTVVLLAESHEHLTSLAYLYLSLELFVITALCIFEFRIASR